MKKYKFLNILVFILFLISISINAVAITLSANNVTYTPKNTQFAVNNVKDAVDSLYLLANNKLEEMYNKGLEDGSNSLEYLGTGTSFNVSNKANYKNFTTDNFILIINDIQINSSGTDNDAYNGSYNHSGNLIPTISYDPSTGIVTVNNTSYNWNTKTWGNTGSLNSINISTSVYFKK